MPIFRLHLFSTRVSDLRPIAGMPLEEFRLGNSPVADLKVLEGLPLTMLELTSIPATDFSPLATLKLTDLRLSNTKFADLTLIRGESLRVLYLDGCRDLRDLAPLKEFQSLETLTLPVQAKQIDFLREMPKLKRLGFSEATLQPADEFWKTFDVRKK
jgi:Leucine-rich repeat (LRR) protein